MSKIKELLNDINSILVFDVDGVLATMEFGQRNHFLTDEEWDICLKNEENVYIQDRVSKRLQNFIKERNINNIYVLTRVNADIEIEYKKEFVNKYYNILKDNVYCVKNDSEKVNKIIEIRNKHPEVMDENIIMIDDTVDVLNDILCNTNYSTAHISSFMDI